MIEAIIPGICLFLILVAVHFAIDIQFQSDFVALNKRRKTPDKDRRIPWYYAMASHVSVHALAVGWFLGFQFGLFEFVAHFMIDVAKCEELTDIHQDQLMHIACKAAWVMLFCSGVI